MVSLEAVGNERFYCKYKKITWQSKHTQDNSERDYSDSQRNTKKSIGVWNIDDSGTKYRGMPP